MNRQHNPIVFDSGLTFEEAILGTEAPEEIISSLSLLDVHYYSFDGCLHQGQLVIHKAVADDIREVFQLIRDSEFPIAKAMPIVRYNWSDDLSMAANNTSAFNYRMIAGTNRISQHALGKAVDINPFLNPVILRDGKASPEGARYDRQIPGTLHDEHDIVRAFRERGWKWGGLFTTYRDNHHFEIE